MEVKLGKKPTRQVFCTDEYSQKYLDMSTDYGWTTSDKFKGMSTGKIDSDGNEILVGDYIKNKKVSGRVVYFNEPCEFRVEVLECRWVKDVNSLELFFPTKLGRENPVGWIKKTCNTDLNEWLNDFPKYHDKEEEGKE